MKELAIGFLVLSLFLILTPSALGEDDCELGARYYGLSTEAASEYRQREAYDFLERAVEVCPTYTYWQELGEAAVAFGEVDLTRRAAIAYGEALQLAGDGLEQSRSIGKYAELLFLNGDPQKALTEGYRARNLAPTSAWIDKLVRDIDRRINSVSAVDIKRGLEDSLFAPLPLTNKLTDGALQQPIGSGSGSRAASQVRSINIPINFQFGSSEVDVRTRRNVGVLADTLVDAEFSDFSFVLVGHADSRGAADANMALSLERANGIYQQIIQLKPELKGRISTEGRGEQEPLSMGNTEFDHHANRRLQVILES